jgi:hypothetical protein
MRKIITGTALVLALGMAGAAHGETESSRSFFTGNQLLQSCQSADSTERGFCLGFVAGIADMLMSGPSTGKLGACFPDGVIVRQAMDVAVQYLVAHPEDRHFPAADLVAVALATTFPCR